MTKLRIAFAGSLLLAIYGVVAATAKNTGGTASPKTVQVHMVATVEPLKDSDAAASLSAEEVQVWQGKTRLPVAAWIPSRGEQAGLQLFVLIDDTSDSSLGSHLDDIREFIRAQPATTVIGLGYMRNTTVNILQNFTADHEQVAKSLRLPLGSTGASDSCYLSLMGLLKGWPAGKIRREVLMITDGIDRLRGAGAEMPMAGRRGMGPQVMPYLSPDVDQASQDAQRYGVLVHSIYTRGVGHYSRNYWEVSNGQNGISKLADETGAESFFLGQQNAVSFKPYLDRLQNILDNQYYLVFNANPGKKAGLQRVKIKTEVAKVEVVTADNVWVPGGDEVKQK